VGAAIGVGVLSKYSIAFLALSLVAGVAALPSQRHWLRSRWFWLGVVATVMVASPNLVWLAMHQFVTLNMEHTIHARDVRIGRAAGYWTDQLKFNLFALPLVVAGLVWLVRSAQFRLLSVFFFGPLVLFAAAKGRGYYLLPAYIAVNAAAGVVLERGLALLSGTKRAVVTGVVCAALVCDAVLIGSMFVQVGRPGSRFFEWQWRNNTDIADDIGWPEFVDSVADAYQGLAPAEREGVAILAQNYGEAGALELYGPAHGLPEPISQVNSFWARGFGETPPENVLVTGGTLRDLVPYFESCRVAGQVRIPYGVKNEESLYHTRIFFCHHMRRDWGQVWRDERRFG
jgi:hypothetical protein